MQQMPMHHSKPAAPPTATPIPCHCIIKLGGSAITNKQKFESLKEDVLRQVCSSIKQHHSTAPGGIVLVSKLRHTMVFAQCWFTNITWIASTASRCSTGSRPLLVIAAARPYQLAALVKHAAHINRFHLQVHGAGSFGHFQASQYGVARGGNDPAAAVQGFVETRRSVMQLNHAVVSALVDAGVPAVGLSPCGAWSCSGRQLQDASAGIAAVQAALEHNLVRSCKANYSGCTLVCPAAAFPALIDLPDLPHAAALGSCNTARLKMLAAAEYRVRTLSCIVILGNRDMHSPCFSSDGLFLLLLLPFLTAIRITTLSGARAAWRLRV
jgi:hypothetical protein